MDETAGSLADVSAATAGRRDAVLEEEINRSSQSSDCVSSKLFASLRMVDKKRSAAFREGTNIGGQRVFEK